MDRKVDHIKTLFATHPDAVEFFQTSDMQCFHTPEAAERHAAGLKNRKVQVITRDQVEAGLEPMSEEQAKEIFSNREAFIASFTKAFGFEPDEQSTTAEIGAATFYLMKYKTQNPAGPLGQIFAEIDGKTSTDEVKNKQKSITPKVK